MTDESVTALTDHFSLRGFTEILRDFRPPTTAFENAGSWNCMYRLYTHTLHSGCVGELTISRRPRGGGGAKLTIHVRRTVARRCVQTTRAIIECGGGPLATPVRWRLEREVRKPDGESIPDLTAVESARQVENGVVVRRNGKERRLFIRGPWTCDWALFEAVPRLPRTTETALNSAVIEDFELVHPDQTISFRKSVRVRLGAERTWRYAPARQLDKGEVERPVPHETAGVAPRLAVFERTGPGIVPVVTWLDESGRVLFVLSGQAACILA